MKKSIACFRLERKCKLRYGLMLCILRSFGPDIDKLQHIFSTYWTYSMNYCYLHGKIFVANYARMRKYGYTFSAWLSYFWSIGLKYFIKSQESIIYRMVMRNEVKCVFGYVYAKKWARPPWGTKEDIGPRNSTKKVT